MHDFFIFKQIQCYSHFILMDDKISLTIIHKTAYVSSIVLHNSWV